MFLSRFNSYLSVFFFFNDTATTEIYTLSLHDALPICPECVGGAKNQEVRTQLGPRGPRMLARESTNGSQVLLAGLGYGTSKSTRAPGTRPGPFAPTKLVRSRHVSCAGDPGGRFPRGSFDAGAGPSRGGQAERCPSCNGDLPGWKEAKGFAQTGPSLVDKID